MKKFKKCNSSKTNGTINKDKLNKGLKKLGFIAAVGTAGFIGYKYGSSVTELKVKIGMLQLFNHTPGLEDAFNKACDEYLKK